MAAKIITVAHSPDTDDLFMFWALKTGRVRDERFHFDIRARDVHELNDAAHDATYDLTALSFAAYPAVCDHYAITTSGASFAARGYGPLLVAKDSLALESLRGKKIAVPGTSTTACLLLRIALADFEPIILRPTQILDAVANESVAAGLLIHEGQIQFEALGLAVIHRIIDTWTKIANDLPLPLGCNAVKRSLGETAMREIAALQKASILYARNHFTEARDACLKENPVLDAAQADRYLSWYANDRTVDFGDDGRRAIALLFEAGANRGFLPRIAAPQFIG